MNKKKTRKRILIFGIIIIGSIFFGFLGFLYPPIPTKWNKDPYCIDLYELYNGANIVENEQIVINQEISDYNYNESIDLLSIVFRDDFYDIQIIIQFHNWSGHEKFNITNIKIGNIYCIKGISLLNSEGVVIGLDIMEIHSIRTIILSLGGLVIIIPLIFYYFKIDFKKLKLIHNSPKKSNRGS